MVEIAEQLPWDAYKAASPDIVNRPLLEAMARAGSKGSRPLIISAGAATLQEVGRACTWLRDIRERLGVLQCVSCYPTPMDQAELGGIAAIADIFDGVVGYSDHTDSERTGALAVAAGAAILEKHVTYDRAAQGPDHAASLEPEDFRKYRAYARIAKRYEQDPRAKPYLDSFMSIEQEVAAYELVARMRERQEQQPKVKRVLPIEEDVRTVSRQSVVARRGLPRGHVLSRGDLTIKRPGTGIPAFELESAIGCTLTRAVEADCVVAWSDVGGV
jgi:sialic acid synthase SpsE